MAENINARRSLLTDPIPVWMRLNTTPSFILAFQEIICVYSTYAASQFDAAFCTLKYNLIYLFGAHFNMITSFYQCNALIIPILTTLLQLKYQGTNSPFQTHATTMRVAVSSSVVYYLAFVALLRSPPRPLAIVAHLFLDFSGYASVASLASLLLSDSARVFVYSIFVLISAAELLYYYIRVLEDEEDVGFHAYTRRINRFLNNLCKIAPNPFRQRPHTHILPI